jgi:hypothetical protein
MVIKSISIEEQIHWDALQNRFPSIAFELCYGSYEKIPCFYDEKGNVNGKGSRGLIYSEDIEKEIFEWKSSLPLEGINILYVYGIGFGHFYQELKSWLHEKKERKIVFFEDDLGILDSLFRQDLGLEILNDLQLHVYYVADEKMWPHLLEECVQTWLSDHIQWTALPSYFLGRERKIRALGLKLLRKSACVHAKVGESLHYQLLIRNVATNLLHIPISFQANKLKGSFKNIPAVICGAGSSLKEEIGFLKGLEQKALVMAGGSAITALGHYGINPHIAIAVDPNEEEHERLKTSSCFETPFVYSSRLHKEVLSSTNMQMGYLCSNTGGLFEAWVHEKLGIHGKSFALELGEEALSVTTLATAFAVEMGCSPILFCGVDLAYSSGQRYCSGVVPSSAVSWKELEKIKRSRDRVIRRKNIEGKFVPTLIKWVMEASCLGSFARKHKEITFLNLSTQGLPIPNAPVATKEDLMSSHFLHDYDLRGKLRAESEVREFPKDSKELLQKAFKEIKDSFQRSLPLFDELLKEIQEKKEKVDDLSVSLDSGKMSLLEMDLEELPAYFVCFHSVFSVYQGILEWVSSRSIDIDDPKERLRFLENKEKLYKSGEKLAKELLDFFKNY